MKKTLTFLILLFAVTTAAFAQSTLTFSYQSVVRNASNRLVQDSTFNVDIQVLEGTTVRYSETRTVTTDHNGMVSFFIGNPTGRTTSSGSLSDVTDWSQVSFQQTYHLSTGNVVAVDPVSPVPYALQAANASGCTSVTNLENRVNEFNTHVCDSVKDCVNGWISDTASVLRGAIPAAANNATITIQKNGTDVDNFTVNASTDKSINITVPTTVAELTDASSYVTASGNNTLSGNNTFTGTNDFTSGTTTVASGFTFGTTTPSTCGNVAVNACDLLTVFDSIQRTIAALRDEINDLRDTLDSLISASQLIISVMSDCSDTIAHCGSIDTAVTYTAAVIGTTPTTYAWNVNGTDSTTVTGDSLTVHYTATTTGYAANTIICTVNGTNDTITTVLQVKQVPTLGLCEECSDGSITVKTKTNVASIVWRNSDNDSVSNNTTSLAMSASIPAGIYTATAKSSDGCTATRTATLGNAIAHPCTVTTQNGNEMGSTSNTIDSVKDHQDNWYRVVQIGTGTNAQCWLAENMRCTSSPKGNLNPGGSNTSYYKAYYYDYSNQTLLSLRERGYLYNWAGALDTNASSYINASFPNRRGICPEGWHIPTDAEWATMESAVAGITINTSSIGYQGSSTDLAASLSGGCDWNHDGGTGKTPNSYSNSNRNSSGFSALPAGDCYGSSFYNVGNDAYFWSATSNSSITAYYRSLYYSNAGVYRVDYDKGYGFSVRCVRDN